MFAGVVRWPDCGVDSGAVGAEGQHDCEGPHDGGDACKELGQDSGDHFRYSTRSGSDASWFKAGRRGDRLDVRCGVRCGSGDGGWVAGGAPRNRALRSQGSSGEVGLSRGARGMRVIASSARSGPVSLPPVGRGRGQVSCVRTSRGFGLSYGAGFRAWQRGEMGITLMTMRYCSATEIRKYPPPFIGCAFGCCSFGGRLPLEARWMLG
jgi:hypothetical protein